MKLYLPCSEIFRRLDTGVKLIEEAFAWARLSDMSETEREEFRRSSRRIVHKFLDKVFDLQSKYRDDDYK